VQSELSHPLILGFYVLGVLGSAWHFGYGCFLFAAKWGIVTGAKAQNRARLAGIGLAVVLMLAGLASLYSFVGKYPEQQRSPMWDLHNDAAEQSRLTPAPDASAAR
jgi:succinate dehydrogenase / fumarate reductase cytochrome b subunit